MVSPRRKETSVAGQTRSWREYTGAIGFWTSSVPIYISDIRYKTKVLFHTHPLPCIVTYIYRGFLVLKPWQHNSSVIKNKKK